MRRFHREADEDSRTRGRGCAGGTCGFTPGGAVTVQMTASNVWLAELASRDDLLGARRLRGGLTGAQGQYQRGYGRELSFFGTQTSPVNRIRPATSCAENRSCSSIG